MDWTLAQSPTASILLGLCLLAWCSGVVLFAARTDRTRRATSLQQLRSSLEEVLRATPMRR